MKHENEEEEKADSREVIATKEHDKENVKQEKENVGGR